MWPALLQRPALQVKWTGKLLIHCENSRPLASGHNYCQKERHIPVWPACSAGWTGRADISQQDEAPLVTWGDAKVGFGSVKSDRCQRGTKTKASWCVEVRFSGHQAHFCGFIGDQSLSECVRCSLVSDSVVAGISLLFMFLQEIICWHEQRRLISCYRVKSLFLGSCGLMILMVLWKPSVMV